MATTKIDLCASSTSGYIEVFDPIKSWMVHIFNEEPFRGPLNMKMIDKIITYKGGVWGCLIRVD